MSSKNKENFQVGLGTQLIICYICLMFILALIGTIVHLTNIGNLSGSLSGEDVKIGVSDPISNLEADYQILLRKKPWARLALCFSPPRNVFKLASFPHKRYSKNPKDIATKPGDLIWENLHVLNGVKALASLYFIYGSTYYFSWYSVTENP